MSKRPEKPKFKTLRPMPPQISEEELQRRIAAFKARGASRIAGPDDSIYRSGLRMTSIRSV